MTELKSTLESGVLFPREEPFTLRRFHPYIGEKWIGNAVCYGCYRSGQAPGQQGPSDAELLEDLRIIAQHWNLMRVYGADDDTRRIPRIIQEFNLPIKVIQGIWLSPEEDDPRERAVNIASVLLGIELAEAYPEIVMAVSVGNETQVSWSGHRMTPESLIRYVRAVRQNVRVAVTTSDDYFYWSTPESQRLAKEIDFVLSHIHPLWNGQTLDEAITWLDQSYQNLQGVHPERDIVIGETGWASDFNAEKNVRFEQGGRIKGNVGYRAQASFLKQLFEWVRGNHVTTFLFEAFDESWKGGGENTPPDEIEKNWGVYHENRTPKRSFLEFLDYQRKVSE